jgi:hypothetical protein
MKKNMLVLCSSKIKDYESDFTKYYDIIREKIDSYYGTRVNFCSITTINSDPLVETYDNTPPLDTIHFFQFKGSFPDIMENIDSKKAPKNKLYDIIWFTDCTHLYSYCHALTNIEKYCNNGAIVLFSGSEPKNLELSKSNTGNILNRFIETSKIEANIQEYKKFKEYVKTIDTNINDTNLDYFFNTSTEFAYMTNDMGTIVLDSNNNPIPRDITNVEYIKVFNSFTDNFEQVKGKLIFRKKDKKTGGYFHKYIKYKNKYLKLKNSLNF